jgi:hypothetical protein
MIELLGISISRDIELSNLSLRSESGTGRKKVRCIIPPKLVRDLPSHKKLNTFEVLS